MIYKIVLGLILLLASNSMSYACDGTSITLLTPATENCDGTYTISVLICLGVNPNWGATVDFDLIPSGGSYTGIASIQSTEYSTTYQYCAAGCAIPFMGSTTVCADSAATVTGIGAGSLFLSMGTLTVSGVDSPGQYLAPDDESARCITQSNMVCDTVTFTTYGYPGELVFTGTEDDACGPTIDTLYCTLSYGGCPDTLAMLPHPCGPLIGSTESSCGNSDGSASIAFTGCCFVPETYLWNDPLAQTTDTAIALSAGVYEVTVWDSIGTSFDTLVEVNDSGSALFGLAQRPVTCLGDSDGAATPLIIAGVPPYTYTWSDPLAQTSDSATGLAPGPYYVLVEDSNGCKGILFFDITEPDDSLALSVNSVDGSCGLNNGSTIAVASGGHLPFPPYTYMWNDPGLSTTSTVTGLSTGMYTVTVMDQYGCTVVDSVSIYNSTGPSLTTSALDSISCFNGADGSVTVAASGSIAPYSYDWSTGDTGVTINSLSSGTFYITVTDFAGCSKDTVYTFLEPALIVSSDSLEICTGDSIYLSGAYQFLAGLYVDSLSAVNGCDSVHTSVLSVQSYSINDPPVTICPGDSTLVYGVIRFTAGVYYDSLTSVGGCDSVFATVLTVDSTYLTVASLSICDGDSALLGGAYQLVAGTYNDTLSTVAGCDSIIATTLTIDTLTLTNLSISICLGDSLLAGGSYQLSSGSYVDSLTTTLGCDSVVTTNLTVDSVYLANDTMVICAGDSSLIRGTWQTTAGTYIGSFTSVMGCDSILVTELLVNPTYSIMDPAMSICSGDSTLIYGVMRSMSGVYYDSLMSVDGCDSVFATLLTVNPTYLTLASLAICDGDSAMLGGAYQLIAGTYNDTLSSVEGCDSIIATMLSVDALLFTSLSFSICMGDSLFAGGMYQTLSGTYIDSLTAGVGCDSIVTTVLTVNPVYLSSDTFVICSGDSSLISGVWQSLAGLYVDSFTSALGCDSILSVQLLVNPSYNTIDPDISICDVGSVLLYGVYRNTAGIYFDSLTTSEGCDSVHSTVLTVNPSYSLNIGSNSICEGDSIFIFGSYRSASGVYSNSYTLPSGCDSSVSMSLTVNPVPAVSFSGLDAEYCSTDAAVLLTGSPAGGAFSGIGFSINEFDPAVAGVGTYTVTYSYADGNGCWGSESQQVDVNNCTGIGDVSFIDHFTIFPNPNTGDFEIEINTGEQQNLQLKITNSFGQLVLSESLGRVQGSFRKTIDLKEYRSGIYVLQLITDRGVITRQVIVE